jgi:cell division protein FtsB
MEYGMVALISVLTAALVYLLFRNSVLKREQAALQEILALKDATIQNLQASRVAVKEVMENLSSHEEVMALVEAGESREEISRKLDIPLNKIELIIKFDKIKREHAV